MILTFDVENFNDKNHELCFVADTNIEEFPEHVELPYGENCNVLRYLLNYGDKDIFKAFNLLYEYTFETNGFAKVKDNFKSTPTFYRVIFEHDNVRYRYELKLNNNHVEYEELYGDTRLIYDLKNRTASILRSVYHEIIFGNISFHEINDEPNTKMSDLLLGKLQKVIFTKDKRFMKHFRKDEIINNK